MMESNSIMKRSVAGFRSFLCTNLPATSDPTNCRYAISANATAVSSTTRVVIHPPMCRRTARNIRKSARDDVRAVLDALKIDKAHIVGLSMGGFATLHFGFTYPDRARSLAICGCGYGAAPSERAQFAGEAEAAAVRFDQLGVAKAAEIYAHGPTRVQHQNKDPRGFREFADMLAGL